jgi:hypothetical protein
MRTNFEVIVLIRLACLDRHSGRSFEALRRLEEAQCFDEASTRGATGRPFTWSWVRHIRILAIAADVTNSL